MKAQWEQRLWGVRFSSPKERGVLLGEAWHNVRQEIYTGEPLRPLLFTTREAARKWCANKRNQYAKRTDCCAKWRFTPVRVHLLVREVT